jgi:hypothetical protein
MKTKLFIAAALIMVVAFFTSAQTFAQQNKTGLAITPLNFDFSLKQGETKTDKVYLTNLSNAPVEINVTARNFSANGEEGDITLTTESIPYSLSSWITISPNHIILPPTKEKTPFEFTITVPNNPDPGGHYGAIIFSTVPKKEAKATAAYVSQEIGTLVFVKTPGDVKEKANIVSFAPEKSFYEFGPINLITRVKSDSTVHVRPSGSILVTDMFGGHEYVSVEPKNVLPGAIRKLQATYDKKNLFGKYIAEVKLSYGTKGQVLTARTSFWAFPVRWGLLALGIILLVIIINTLIVLFFVRKGRKKSE